MGRFVTMVPPTWKRSALTPSQRSASSSTRKSANAGSKTPPTKNNKSTGSNHVTTVTRPLSDLGFSSTKRPKYQIGTKMLLDDSIYDKEAPAEVKGHYFVYKISSICESGRTVTIQYKNQVVRNGGNMFRVYKEGEDSQVCFLFVRFVCLFISFVIWIRSYKIIDCLFALSFLLNSSSLCQWNKSWTPMTFGLKQMPGPTTRNNWSVNDWKGHKKPMKEKAPTPT